MDAIGIDWYERARYEGGSLYIHIEYPHSDHVSLSAIPRAIDIVTALCGWTVHGEKAIYYDGLQDVNCPVCLKITSVAKSARIGRRRLNAAARHKT